MAVLESQLSVQFSAISQRSVKISTHCLVVTKFCRSQFQLSVKKRVISEIAVEVLTNSQQSVKPHPDPLFALEKKTVLSFKLDLSIKS